MMESIVHGHQEQELDSQVKMENKVEEMSYIEVFIDKWQKNYI